MIQGYDFWGDLKILIIKVIIPALVGVAINIAVKAKENKLTWLSGLVTFATGVGFAFLFNEFIQHKVGESWRVALIGLVAMSGEKIAYYFLYTFNVKKFLNDFINKNSN
jgi:hypothetical protein